jgi:uncharacterized protein
MGFRLIPKEEKFFDMFCEQAEALVEAAQLLRDIVDNYTDLDRKVLEMNKVEHKADEIMHRIVNKLYGTFITPLDQEDIHSLASAIDDIVDYIDASVERMLLYKISKPTDGMIHLVNILQRAAEETATAVRDLGQHRKSTAVLRQSSIEIHSLENLGDTANRQAIAALFECGESAIEVIKWKEIYENLETAIDKCEDVANVLEQIILKHA